MRRLTRVLAVLILLFAALAATPATTARERAEAPANLIANPGFEEGAYDPAAAPPGWARQSFGPAALTWDNDVARAPAGRSVKIAASASPDDAAWSQTVAVRPHTWYRLSAWVKTADVQHSPQAVDAGANLSLLGTWTHSAGLFGSNDWTKLTLVFSSGDEASVQVALRLGYWSGTSLGTAWFDDVELTPITWSASDPHPSWKILALIYRSTDLSYTDDAGVAHRLVGAMTDEQVQREADTTALFVAQDIPALNSGNMTPELTIRYPERTLAPSRMGDAWWPGPQDTAPERDPAFDSVIVIWQPWVRETVGGQPTGDERFIGAAAGMAYGVGAGQLYTSLVVNGGGWPGRNTLKHEWGHSILFYFDAAGLSPAPAVSNHATVDDYVHCPSGARYIWEDETPESPIPNSIYNNESGFTHDYYSGTVATSDQPTRCLGATPEAWAFGGPVTNILSQAPAADEDLPTHAEMAIEDIKEKVNELVDDGVLGQARARPMVRRLDAALAALWDGDSRGAVRELRAFSGLVRAAMEAGRLPRAEGRPLIAAAGAVIDELRQ